MKSQNTQDVRTFPDWPRIGVGVIIFKDEKVLLVCRNQEPAKGKWSFPGGMVELGESIREAAMREVEEECDIQIQLYALVDTFEYIEREQDQTKYHFIVLDYYAEFREGTLNAGSDVADAKWFTKQDLDELQLDKTLRDMIDKAYKLRARQSR